MRSDSTDEVPTRQRRKEARPQELLDAALELFVEKGFTATRAEEVAQRAGVSKGTLYLYYPSKEELFKAVVRQNLGSLIAEGQEAVAQFQGASAELLVQLMLTWWERVGRTRAAGIHKIILAEVRNFPELAQFYADEVIAPAEALFGAVLGRGITSGEFRDLPPRETAHALLAPMIFIALHQHSVGACPVQGCATMDPESLLRTHLDLVLRGMLRRPGASESGR
ncbi:MAG: TetR/AcrR family transcriptional regulator [Betaproteobacteria bacterium]|nr:TetR/AcrR family transcriptional regulator [Betaproteobacteria bacterium]MCC6248031.1 TetR/AcrR family transcriptional regulator [Rubrivivax sp.]MCL4700071.1 TetR/AcrR family transcriptional regulator [Burkholderiaceae bacterium]